MITDKIITTPSELISIVCEEYQKFDQELTSLFFDFNVDMKKADIIEAYAKVQKIINGDDVIRLEDGEDAASLIPTDSRAVEYEQYYRGNLKDYLENMNEQTEFVRFNEGEVLSFVW